MKDERWCSNTVLCPFYRFESAYCVWCEGLREGHLIRQSFPVPEQKRSFVRTFCAGGYRRCLACSDAARERMRFWAEEEPPEERPYVRRGPGQLCLWNPNVG